MTEAFLSTSLSPSSPKPSQTLRKSECSAKPLDSQRHPGNTNNLPSNVFVFCFFWLVLHICPNCNGLRVKVAPFTEDKIPLCFIGINYRSNLNTKCCWNWQLLYFVCFFLHLMTTVTDQKSSLTKMRKMHFYSLWFSWKWRWESRANRWNKVAFISWSLTPHWS